MKSFKDIHSSISSNYKRGLRLAREVGKEECMKLNVTTLFNKIQENQAKAQGKKIRKANNALYFELFLIKIF